MQTSRTLRGGGIPQTTSHDLLQSAPLDVAKAYEFIGLGAMDVTKPYKSIGFWAMDVTKPYKFIGFGALHPKRHSDSGCTWDPIN